MSTYADPDELEKFHATADAWWDENGPLAPLHRFNPVRIAFIRDAVLRGASPALVARPLSGVRVLDVGCGGGVLAEPLARLGGKVVGIDLVEASLDVARRHAAEQGLAIDYRSTSVEDLAAAGERFDLVVASEVIEHIDDQEGFVAELARLVDADGTLCVTTLNRTWRSFSEAVIGAEYLLGWLPRGTHDWRRFVRPSELSGWLRRAGFAVTSLQGVGFDGRENSFRLRDDISVNYLLSARRP